MKLLKLLAQKMDKEEQKCLPLLLNCFYYRETLFIVYELLRDNLYHMYARNDRTHTRTPSPGPCCARTHLLELAPHALLYRASYKYVDECRLPKYFTVRRTAA